MGVVELAIQEHIRAALSELSYLEADSEYYLRSKQRPSLYLSQETIPDILILKEINQFPESLDQIENIDRWFPEKKTRVPAAGIDIQKSEFEASDLYVSQAITASDNQSPLPTQITIYHAGDASLYTQNEDFDYINGTSVNDKQALVESMDTLMSDLTEEIDTVDIEELPDVDDTLDSFKPVVFHFNEVLRAYQAGQDGPLIVLSSVFFESRCYNLLEEYLSDIQPNEHAGLFIDSDDNFETILDACRFYNLIEEDEYTVIDLVRRSRNNYAHELERYHSSQETPIEAEDRLEDAIEIYEGFIGVKDSMLG